MELKSYFNMVLAAESDIFKSCLLELAPMRELIIEGLFSSIDKFESFTMVNVHCEVISKVVNKVDAAEKIGVQVDWIDKAIDEIIPKKEHYALVQETRLVRDQLTQMQSK